MRDRLTIDRPLGFMGRQDLRAAAIVATQQAAFGEHGPSAFGWDEDLAAGGLPASVDELVGVEGRAASGERRSAQDRHEQPQDPAAAVDSGRDSEQGPARGFGPAGGRFEYAIAVLSERNWKKDGGIDDPKETGSNVSAEIAFQLVKRLMTMPEVAPPPVAKPAPPSPAAKATKAKLSHAKPATAGKPKPGKPGTKPTPKPEKKVRP